MDINLKFLEALFCKNFSLLQLSDKIAFSNISRTLFLFYFLNILKAHPNTLPLTYYNRQMDLMKGRKVGLTIDNTLAILFTLPIPFAHSTLPKFAPLVAHT